MLFLALNCLISLPRICFDQTLFCLPCIFWILLFYSKFAFCFLALGKAMTPFLCILIQKSYFLIMHYSWEAILHWVEQLYFYWYCIFLPFLNMTSVWIIYVESDDPICVHSVFKCKIINNAQMLGEQSYMLLNIGCLQLVFDPNDMSLWKTNIFRLGTLCHHEKWRGFVYSLMVFSSFGILLSFVIFSKWYL